MVWVCTFAMMSFCIGADLRGDLVVLLEGDDEVLVELLKKLLGFDFDIRFRVG